MSERASLLDAPASASTSASTRSARALEAGDAPAVHPAGPRASHARAWRVRAACGAGALTLLLGAAATHAARSDAAPFGAAVSTALGAVAARHHHRRHDASRHRARPAPRSSSASASPQHLRAPTASLDGFDPTRWRAEEEPPKPADSANLGQASAWGSVENALPWWAQPAAANALLFPDSRESAIVDEHLRGVKVRPDPADALDAPRLGVAADAAEAPPDAAASASASDDTLEDGSHLAVATRDAIEREERVAARRRRRREVREFRRAQREAARAAAEGPEDDAPFAGEDDRRAGLPTPDPSASASSSEAPPEEPTARELSPLEPARANRRAPGDNARDHGGRGALSDDDALRAIETREAARRARVEERRREREDAAAEREDAVNGTASDSGGEDVGEDVGARGGSSAASAAKLGGASERSALAAGYLPLDVKRAVPLNPFAELTPRQHADVAGVYESLGWDGMKLEAEARWEETEARAEAEARDVVYRRGSASSD